MVNMQRIKDCEMLISKWDIWVIPRYTQGSEITVEEDMGSL